MSKRRVRLIVKLLLLLTGIYASVGALVWFLLAVVWPTNYFATYPLIPVFFWLVGLGMALSMEATHTEKPDSVTMTYMVARSVKLMLTGLFVGAYAWLVHDNLKAFGLTTLIFYMVFLVMESYVFYLYEKRRMKRAEKRRAVLEKMMIHAEAESKAEPYAGKEVENEEIDV